MIWIIYFLTIVIYFFTLRSILSKGLVFEFNNLFQLLLIIFLCFVPVINIVVVIIMLCDDEVYKFYRVDGNKILRKILFIKDKRN